MKFPLDKVGEPSVSILENLEDSRSLLCFDVMLVCSRFLWPPRKKISPEKS